MKTLMSLLVVLAVQSCLAGPVSEPISFGAWSEATNGLRGRLAFAEDPKLFGARMGVVYLELQNVSFGDTMYVYYKADQSPFRCELRDSSQALCQSSGCEYDGMIPGPCWLALPHDSALRFRMTLGGFGVPQNGGLFIAGCISDCWVIPKTAAKDYFLSGTLTITAPKDDLRPRVWEGTLKLPQVKIPVKKPGSSTFLVGSRGRICSEGQLWKRNALKRVAA
jgi:hypothetical protein